MQKLSEAITDCPLCGSSLSVSKKHTITTKTSSRDGGKETVYIHCHVKSLGKGWGGTILKLQTVKSIRS